MIATECNTYEEFERVRERDQTGIYYNNSSNTINSNTT